MSGRFGTHTAIRKFLSSNGRRNLLHVTKCVEKGMNPVMIGKITGHAEIRMTQHYTRLSDEFILRQHEVH